jgi:hypothetical protein
MVSDAEEDREKLLVRSRKTDRDFYSIVGLPVRMEIRDDADADKLE